MKHRFTLISLGCPKNLVDSETFSYIAVKHGYEQAENILNLEFILINTCSFIKDAISELNRVLKTVSSYKAKGRVKKIFVSGCIMKRGLEEMQQKYPLIDAWIAIRDYQAFEKLIGEDCLSDYQRDSLTEGPYAYLKISDGCNNGCTYCTIPSIRGKLHSQSMDELLREARLLSDSGARELVVIAQDTSAYGMEKSGKKQLSELLKRVHEIEGFQWIRLMYLHPKHIDKDLVKTIAELPKIVHAFEMPLQHCNDGILKAMNRQYSKMDIVRIYNLFKETLPDAEFRTTFMTGFPGETTKEFDELLQFIQDYRFLRLGVFAFSPEEGTPAYGFSGRASRRTAQKRKNDLLSLHNTLSEQYLADFIGTDVEVIVEETYTKVRTCTGRAWFDAPEIDGIVNFHGKSCGYGDIVKVRIEDLIDIDLYGSLKKVVHKNAIKK
jgi:ribosomal protein S12 methylthiotransferase